AKAAQENIKLIIVIPYDIKAGSVYALKDGFYAAYIEDYKKYAAILMYELGNEYNLHPEWFNGDINVWYAAAEEAAQVIKSIDPSRPVSMSFGGWAPTPDIIAQCPSVDVWSLNVYQGLSLSGVYSAWQSLGVNKPMYVGETGADSWNATTNQEDEAAQAYAAKTLWQEYAQSYTNVCAGITFMTLQDNPTLTQSLPLSVYPDNTANEWAWGWLRSNGTPKAVVDTMANVWAGNGGKKNIKIKLAPNEKIEKKNSNKKVSSAIILDIYDPGLLLLTVVFWGGAIIFVIYHILKFIASTIQEVVRTRQNKRSQANQQGKDELKEIFLSALRDVDEGKGSGEVKEAFIRNRQQLNQLFAENSIIYREHTWGTMMV
ncbi:MAG TPA: cellulase family glycosylhydrolase, partial [Candidatus Omnitrophota bacterium]|nr:cellulase family glycosylhydrolase [Candidatus Omnitrophota bacterium]